MSEYVKNKDFYELLLQYNNEQDEKVREKLREKISCNIFLIAKKLATKYNFNGYSFVDDMIGEGVIAGLRGIDKFKVDKSTNPFSFFTQIIYNSFIGVIMDERKKHNVPEEFGDLLVVEPKLVENVPLGIKEIVGYSKTKENETDNTLF